MTVQGKRVHVWCFSMLALSLVLGLVPVAFSAARAAHTRPALIGPKTTYLAIGDSLAFGYQPDVDWGHGYASDFYTDLKKHGVTHYDNLACPGETSVTLIHGGCPFPLLRKYGYIGSQLQAAVSYLQKNAGKVSPVTLDIGANDLLTDLTPSHCSINSKWVKDLATLDTNMTKTILPQLLAAMTVNGQVTGDLVVMNYYDPYQDLCADSVQYVQQLNQHLQDDVSGFATFVDIFTPFGGAASPNPNLCSYTWICSNFKDIHATKKGYDVMASAFEQATGY